MKMGRKKIRVLILYLALIRVVIGAAFVPEIFYIDLNTPRTHELTVINDTNNAMRYRVSIKTDTKSVGEEWDNRVLSEEWVRFYPKVISVSPQSRGVVRFRINPPKDLEDGEIKGVLYLEEMQGMKLSSEDLENPEEGEASIGLGLRVHYQLSIYAQKGEVEYLGVIDGFKTTKMNEELKNKYFKTDEMKEMTEEEIKNLNDMVRFSMVIKNKGNASLRPWMEVSYLDEKGKLISKEETLLGVTAVGKNTEEGWLNEMPEETKSLKVEVYHYDLNKKERTVKVHEGNYKI